jgi:hypothetical protein
MFDPNKAKAEKAEKVAKAKAIKQIREWCLTIIPADCLHGLNCDVREV